MLFEGDGSLNYFERFRSGYGRKDSKAYVGNRSEIYKVVLKFLGDKLTLLLQAFLVAYLLCGVRSVTVHGR